jgi:hypothetical protein
MDTATSVRSGYCARRSFSEGGLKQSESESESEKLERSLSKCFLTHTLTLTLTLTLFSYLSYISLKLL